MVQEAGEEEEFWVPTPDDGLREARERGEVA